MQNTQALSFIVSVRAGIKPAAVDDSGILAGLRRRYRNPASACDRRSFRFSDHRLQPFRIRRPTKHFIANCEARSAGDAEGLRLRADLQAPDIGAHLRKNIELAVHVEPDGFSYLNDFALIQRSAQLVRRT